MAIQSPKAFNIDAALLDTSASPSDRFAYMNQYIAFEPEGTRPPVPGYRAAYLGMSAALMPKEVRDAVLKEHPEVLAYADALVKILEKPAPVPNDERRRAAAVATKEIGRIVTRLQAYPQAGADEALISGLKRIQQAGDLLLGPQQQGGGGGAAPVNPGTLSAEQQLALQLGSELGFLYLDRTRITPEGFAVGEHLYSLSLAPGEEVTIEQKTYSERQTSYEDLQDQEATLDLEVSSTLTGELAQGLNQELSRLSKDSQTNATHVGANIDGVEVSLGPTNASSVDDGDRITSNSSLKTTHQSSTKVASKYRTQHKITFRVSTVDRFETTSKRVIRNPNTYTPIDLLYFKVLQRLRLRQERYGVRLCWAPAVRDPAGAFWARLLAIRDALFAVASKVSAGPRPQPPSPPVTAPAVTQSTVMAANKFDWFNGSQSNDYTVTIPAPSGYVWDGDAAFVTSSLMFTFSGSRPNAADVRSPSNDGTGMTCIVHVGVDNRAWLDRTTSPPTPKFENIGTASFTVAARFVPNNVQADDEYNQRLAEWKAADEAWQAQDAQVKAAALAQAQKDWDALRTGELSRVNPLFETFGVLISQMFPSVWRDDVGEIDFWERLFDWSHASLRLYPAWWNGTPLREPSLGPTHFVNASWGRLFLPVRIGNEAEAIRWIYRLSGAQSTNAALDAYIKDTVNQITKYRKNNFGSETEVLVAPTESDPCPAISQTWICMGSWQETLPTDGTHIEVLQSTTIAADDDSRQRLTDATALRAEEVSRQKGDNALRSTIAAAGGGTITTGIRFRLTDKPTESQS
jgi:hypothetical protein